MKNKGKVFEDQFKKSIPDYCLLQRLNDPIQAFVKNDISKFSHKNPCDFIMFDSKKRLLYYLELKSTKYKSMSFEDISEQDPDTRMIHKHQIESLSKVTKYNFVISGFLLNFRDEESHIERTYFMEISLFMKMCERIQKKSFNEIDLLMYGAKKINGIKKRVNYIWNIEDML